MQEKEKSFRVKSDHQQRVEKFMALAKQDIPKSPVMPDENIRRLRAKLILEEALETVRDLGFAPMFDFESLGGRRFLTKEDIVLVGTGNETLSGITDGCADVIVVTTGTLSACGLADVSIQEEVDENNLAKFGPGHSYREDGKLIKPPNHKPPALNEIIERQIRESQNDC